MTKSILRSEQGGSSAAAAAAAPVSVVVDVVTHDTEPSVCSVLSNGGPGHAHHQDTAVGTLAIFCRGNITVFKRLFIIVR